MKVFPLTQDARVSIQTFAPPEIAGEPYVLEDASEITVTKTAPDGTTSEVTLTGGGIAQARDGNGDPIAGTYYVNVRATMAGKWTVSAEWQLEGGERGNSGDLHILFQE